MLHSANKSYNRWRANAQKLLESLEEFGFITLPKSSKLALPVYLRFPIVVDTPARTERIFDKLQSVGIGVSRSYRFTLPGLHGGGGEVSAEVYPGALQLSTCLLTLPVNHYLDEFYIDRILSVFMSERDATWR
jgi:dTDP-4-amino-4,6-dideoxygalactose transaminase